MINKMFLIFRLIIILYPLLYKFTHVPNIIFFGKINVPFIIIILTFLWFKLLSLLI